MIILTGAGGFIGSVMLGYLNKQGISDVVLFDDLQNETQYRNLIGKKFRSIHPHSSYEKTSFNPIEIRAVIHLGANSNTLERDWTSIYKSNVLSTRMWNQFCKENDIPFIFASSAAVYGNGAGPLNQYAFSKQASEQEIDAVVLRLFNVYGPNEYHKGRMASTIMHWHNQIQETGQYKLFEGSRQLHRDLIYVEDVAKTIYHFIENYQTGVYDLGTGISVDFETVADTVAAACRKGSKNFILMPEDLKTQYQNNTRADTGKLKDAGVDTSKFLTIGLGIEQYVDYLKTSSFY
jgi:ADP-L-glycero-D-manno-heptose 6-epimerase